MTGELVNLRLRSHFFDTDLVKSKTTDATRRNLSKAGAFVRRKARTKTRQKGKKPSLPGQPPKQRVGTLRKLIYFAYDPPSAALVVGPETTSGGGIVPGVLECGGTSTIKGRKITIAARPYMQPSLAEEQPKFPDLWRNSVAP